MNLSCCTRYRIAYYMCLRVGLPILAAVSRTKWQLLYAELVCRSRSSFSKLHLRQQQCICVMYKYEYIAFKVKKMPEHFRHITNTITI